MNGKLFIKSGTKVIAGGTVTIKAPSGSYAERFARKHEINFEEV